MSSEVDYVTNRGTLFKNDRKTEDWHPEYRGQLNVEGVEYWVDGKIRTSGKTGDKFFSLKLRKKDPRKAEPAVDLSDDIPF